MAETDDLVVLRAWSDESAAQCIQRHHRRSNASAAAASAVSAPSRVGTQHDAQKGGVQPAYVVVGALLLLGLNFVFTHLMDESVRGCPPIEKALLTAHMAERMC